MKFTLSPGETAYIMDSRYGIASAYPGTVERITPSGQLIVRHGNHSTRFSVEGRATAATDGARLVDAGEYERASRVIEQQRTRTLAWLACKALAGVEPSAGNKQDVLAAIDAARVAVEKII